MPSASAPVGPALKFKGCIPYGFSFDQGRDEWGLTQQEQETYVEQFRATLERKHSWAKDQGRNACKMHILPGPLFELKRIGKGNRKGSCNV
eukprot:scaffold293258_cov18-Tisochrysis_lutea.AAC.1